MLEIIGQDATTAAAKRLVTDHSKSGLIELLRGNRRRSRLNDAGPVSISRRIGSAQGNMFGSTYGPTAMHREQLAIGRAQFATLQTELDGIVAEDLPRLERELDAAGVPWTPGRGVPADR